MKITINKPTEFEAVYLEVDAGVRYWDDGYINGMEDTDCEETDGIPQMPCAEYMGEQHMVLRGYNWRWRPLIILHHMEYSNLLLNYSKKRVCLSAHRRLIKERFRKVSCVILKGNHQKVEISISNL